MEERNDINKFRKKRAREKLRLKLALALLIALVVLLVALNWGSIIAPLKDAALDVGEGGFPVELPGSVNYTLDGLGENFYLLTDTYIYTYNSEGARITEEQHGFQSPVSLSNNRRVLVYDKNGKEFSLFSRTGKIYTGSVEDSIVFASIGNEERSAVITTSTRYSNYLYVFNGEGKQIFRWASPDYKIMQAEFSADDKSIFVAALGAQQGNLQLYLIRFDLDNAESHIWQTYIGNDISYSLEQIDGRLYMVTGGGSYLVDCESGELVCECAFSRSITDIPRADTYSVIFKDTASSGDILTVYNQSLEAYETLYINSLTCVRESGGRFYVLGGQQINSYDSELQLLKTYELDDVYSDMIIMNGYAYLLGYNVVSRIEL